MSLKIIVVDNFGRESVADALVAESVSEYWGKLIVEALNDKQHEGSQDYFRLVDGNYTLWRGMEDLI